MGAIASRQVIGRRDARFDVLRVLAFGSNRPMHGSSLVPVNEGMMTGAGLTEKDRCSENQNSTLVRNTVRASLATGAPAAMF